jgi:casein kinase II subunit beta
MVCWLDTFLARPSSQLFIRIDEEFLMTRFNTYGLQSKLKHFDLACSLLQSRVSSYASPSKDVSFQVIESEAIILYGYLHARFLATRAGIELMFNKYTSFQICPRVFCRDTHCLPCGISDEFGRDRAAMFCPSCGDLYRISSPEIAAVDGAFFGSTWANLFLKVHPEVVLKDAAKVYVPKLFGFRIHNPNAPIGSDESDD